MSLIRQLAFLFPISFFMQPLVAQDRAEIASWQSFGLGWMLFGGFVFLLAVGLLAWFAVNVVIKSGRPRLR